LTKDGVSESYNYTAFGETTKGDRSLTDYAFTAQRVDKYTNLQYHRARWLDTGLGRWMSEDPVFDFPNNFGSFFNYVKNNPILVKDPNGLFNMLDVLITSAIIGIVAGISVGIEYAIDNDDNTSFGQGFKVGFLWGFLGALFIGLALLAIITYAPIFAIHLLAVVLSNSIIITKILIGLGVIATAFGVSSAVKQEEYWVAGKRLVEGIFGLAALTSRGRAIATGAWNRIKNYVNGGSKKLDFNTLEDLAENAPVIKTFRGTNLDFENPETVIQSGLQGKGPNRNLQLHLANSNQHRTDFVSTTTDIEIAQQFASGTGKKGWLYVIRSKRGLDADSIYPDVPTAGELEYSIPGKVRPDEIYGWFHTDEYGDIVSDFVLNPNFKAQ